jgi:hypothetical protein
MIARTKAMKMMAPAITAMKTTMHRTAVTRTMIVTVTKVPQAAPAVTQIQLIQMKQTKTILPTTTKTIVLLLDRKMTSKCWRTVIMRTVKKAMMKKVIMTKKWSRIDFPNHSFSVELYIKRSLKLGHVSTSKRPSATALPGSRGSGAL